MGGSIALGITVVRTGDFGRKFFFLVAGAGSEAEFFLLSLLNIFRGSSRPSESSESSDSSSPSELGITLACLRTACEPGIKDVIDASENELFVEVWATGDKPRVREFSIDELIFSVVFVPGRRWFGNRCAGGGGATTIVSWFRGLKKLVILLFGTSDLLVLFDIVDYLCVPG